MKNIIAILMMGCLLSGCADFANQWQLMSQPESDVPLCGDAPMLITNLKQTPHQYLLPNGQACVLVAETKGESHEPI